MVGGNSHPAEPTPHSHHTHTIDNGSPATTAPPSGSTRTTPTPTSSQPAHLDLPHQPRIAHNNDHPRAHRPTNSRANILLATFNIKGRSSVNPDTRHQTSKWTDVHRFIRQKQLSILCLQETHLDQSHIDDIKTLYGKRIEVYNSALPTNPGASAGVAFVINKERLRPTDITTVELVPGRALLLTLKWNDTNVLTLLNIYAPNPPQEHPTFWAIIRQKLTALHVQRVDLLLGDFNITEDPLDRAPPRTDDYHAQEALREFRESLSLQDRWRHDNPNTRSYTFVSNTQSFSRLDRIYSTRQLSQTLYDWEMTDTIIPSDHKMVLVRYVPPHMPFIGPGRWTLPLALLSDSTLLDQITTRGMSLQDKLEQQPTTPMAPQQLWASFKKEISDLAKTAGKTNLAKMTNKIRALTHDLHQLEQNDNIESIDPTPRTNAALLRQEIQHLEAKRGRNEKARAQAKWFANGERINKYWTRTASPRKPRDAIYALHNPTTNRLTTKSSEMAAIAHRYHDTLQEKDLLDHNDPTRRAAQRFALSQIPDTQKLTNPDTDLHHPLTAEQTQAALMSSKNGTATGLDGIPYELWKALSERHTHAAKTNSPSFDVIKCMTLVYRNIQTHGMDPDSDFSAGWMCPLYKKKDKTKIENYRPITLLNTDYKIMTKALATQLAKHACHLLHPDQSGFVPSRSIFNPIRLAETMSAYADYMEEDGAIVALDQEKAYDKIDHRYLLDTLRTFQLPALFIDTVGTLYRHARTRVVINGVQSAPYLVTRGVRQGDPLSCLLFDLAIEPLAASIRNTPDIAGYTIPHSKTVVKVNLYADDTTVYLSQSDRYDTLERLLKTWCVASGAKFNLEKTEIIPIGTMAHRARILHSRRLHPDDAPLADGIRIAPDGHPTRILGAWIGNDINHAQPWSPIIDKIKDSLDRWATANPTLDAKRLIIQMVVGGMTQFLTKAQGMPSTTARTLNTIIRNFLWNGANRSPPGLSMKNLTKSVTQGGINVLDLETRNHAIELTWVRDYLNLSASRPTWTYVLDAIINTMNNHGIPDALSINTFLTSLCPSGRPRRGGKPIPRPLIAILKTAKRFNLTLAPRKLSKPLKRQMPAWYHIGVPPNQYHKTKTKCLREVHQITLLKDLVKTCRSLTRATTNHRPSATCPCHHCQHSREKGCTNPHKCAQTAREIIGSLDDLYFPFRLDGPPKDGLSLTHRRKEKNNRAKVEKGDEIIFDPTITTRGSLDECFRILTDNPTQPQELASRLRNPRLEQGQHIASVTAYTDGSCFNNGKQNATCGGGVWFGDDNPLNKAIRIPGDDQSNQTGEIAAIAIAIKSTDPTAPLTIISDSRYAIDGLTKHLTSWEDRGWTGTSNAKWFQFAAYQLRLRAAPTNFKWVKGHAQNAGNEHADRLANEGAQKPQPDDINLLVPDHFQVQGIKLSSLTQQLAYQALKLRNDNAAPYTRSAIMNLDITRHAIKNLTNEEETDASIWRHLRHPDLRRPVQQFLYRAMTGSLKIGSFWSNIPTYEHRSTCIHCPGETETFEHIVTDCTSPCQKIIWDLAKSLWPGPITGAFPPHFGVILGCGNIAPPTQNTPPTPPQRGAARLKRILISESAHLIWALRCDHVIGNQTYPPTAIKSRWLRLITTRLDIDRRMAKSNRKPLSSTKVLHTWNTVLHDDTPLPPDWPTNLEVLVGIKLPRPPDETGDTG